VLKFAQEISSRGMARSVMEIDDKWQRTYGDLHFDVKKFPKVSVVLCGVCARVSVLKESRGSSGYARPASPARSSLLASDDRLSSHLEPQPGNDKAVGILKHVLLIPFINMCSKCQKWFWTRSRALQQQRTVKCVGAHTPLRALMTRSRPRWWTSCTPRASR
jgi:hypothetical protein